MQKLSSEEYQFKIVCASEFTGVVIELLQVNTGKVKHFRQAVGSADSLYNHMCSLTDSQCEQWFNAGERKKKQKA